MADLNGLLDSSVLLLSAAYGAVPAAEGVWSLPAASPLDRAAASRAFAVSTSFVKRIRDELHATKSLQPAYDPTYAWTNSAEDVHDLVCDLVADELGATARHTPSRVLLADAKGEHSSANYDCTVQINVKDATEATTGDDETSALLSNWIHEALHKRGLDRGRIEGTTDQPDWHGGRALLGAEEGAVEGLAQWIVRSRLGLAPVTEAYGYYVGVSEKIAEMLGLTPDAWYRIVLAHRLDELHSDRYRAYIDEIVINAARPVSVAPGSETARRDRIRECLAALFSSDRDFWDGSYMTEHDVRALLHELKELLCG